MCECNNFIKYEEGMYNDISRVWGWNGLCVLINICIKILLIKILLVNVFWLKWVNVIYYNDNDDEIYFYNWNCCVEKLFMYSMYKL